MKKNKLATIRFCGSKFYKKSGIGNFSNTYIRELKNKGYNIFDKRINIKNNYIRLFIQFFIYPLQVITKYRNNTKVFRDEGMLLYTLYPFFPYNNSIFIVHDIRNFDDSVKEKTFLQKIYFYLIENSLKNLNKANCIITPSEFTKNKIIKNFGVKGDIIHVIYSPLDLNIYRVIQGINKDNFLKKYGIKTDKKILLNVGSEESRKNIITILKAMKNLDDYIFIKIGKPIIKQNREEHLKFIKDNKLENKVFFIDFVDTNEDLVKFYNIADIFIFPSLFEGFGRPPIEAQACGCPVISSDKGGLKEVLLNSAIILENPENFNELVEKIKLLDKNRKNVQISLKNVGRFSLDNNVEKWSNIFIH